MYVTLGKMHGRLGHGQLQVSHANSSAGVVEVSCAIQVQGVVVVSCALNTVTREHYDNMVR